MIHVSLPSLVRPPISPRLTASRQIRDNAELAVRNLLKRVAKERGTTELEALEHLDDGTPVRLKVTIDDQHGSAKFDFSGSGPEMIGEPLVDTAGLGE